MKIQLIKYSLVLAGFILSSCNDFLDREPLDSVMPSQYLNTEADLAAYSINQYNFNTHGGWGIGTVSGDVHTDNMVTTDPSYNHWAKGNWKVPTDGEEWDFSNIRNCNYFLEQVLPKWNGKAITGNEENIKHYIGEIYFIRAWNYFSKLRTYGDFPIVTRTLTDDKSELTDASQRRPRNEVARFIIQDLDSAILLLKTTANNKNRLTRNAALLVKSRVALFEASWLTYHKGTPRVPGENGWPGAKMSYNNGLSINIDNEISYFLTQAMNASKEVADAIPLTQNSGKMNPVGQSYSGWNPYFEMFALEDMGTVPEILFWRAYSSKFNITHGVSVYLRNGANNGLTKGYVDGFLMKNGLPIYAPGSNYKGDVTLMKQKEDRDERLQLFMFGEKDRLLIVDDTTFFNYPRILEQKESRDVTGFRVRKCYSYNPEQAPGSGLNCTYGSIVFRGVEAYLNYIEASYMKNKSLDGTATGYWKAIRQRAGVSDDLNKTIAATDLSKENDWAKYSGETLIDPTLFNIRRERRNELIGESMRWDDLKRWRALDMVKNYIIEGFNLWDEAYKADDYKADELGEDGKPTGNKKDLLIPAGGNLEPNVSSPTISGKYLRPYQIIKKNNEVYDGYNWSKAFYLSPVPYFQIKLTASDPSNIGSSTIYQNPYWPIEASQPALE